MTHWLDHTVKWLEDGDQLGLWNLRHRYGNPKMDRIVPRLNSQRDRRLLGLSGRLEDETSYHSEAAATIVVTMLRQTRFKRV